MENNHNKKIIRRYPEGDEIDYIDNKGQKRRIDEYSPANNVKMERERGDYTEILLDYAKNKKIIKLHTWVYKGMIGRILEVDLKKRVFKFYNTTTKTIAYYSLNIVRGIEETGVWKFVENI